LASVEIRAASIWCRTQFLTGTTEHTKHTETEPCLSVCSVCLDGERNVACSGNIETLLDYAITDEGGHPAMTNYCFAGLVK